MSFLNSHFFSQSVVYLFQRAVLSPATEVFPHQVPRRQVMGKIPPLTTGSRLIEDRIPDLTTLVLRRTPGAPVFGDGFHQVDQCPLSVR